MPLRSKLIRLAYTNPEFRGTLLPLIKESASLMGGFHVPLKELPPFLVKILAREAQYKRRDIEVIPQTSVGVSGSSFEGNRSVVIMVNLGTQQYQTELGDYSGGMGTSPIDRGGKLPVPSNGAIIVGEYGGRGSFARIYINPNNVAALIEDSSPEELSEDEKYALTYINMFNSGGRKDAFQEKGLGTYGTSNPLVRSLSAKGLVKIQGAGVLVTTKGKNTVGKLDRKYERTW